MLSLSPSSLSLPTWPLEATTDHAPSLIGEDPFAGHGLGAAEAAPQESFAFSSGQFDQLDDGREPNWPTPTSEESSTRKRKLSHNAYERDRRKKVNGLYSSLRSLLPEAEHHKKLSIPCTVSRVLQYIPELQRQVERLQRRKEEIEARLSREGDQGGPRQAGGNGGGRHGVRPVISVDAGLGGGEITVQIICSTSCRRTRRRPLMISELLEYLEGEGLGVVGASFLSVGDDRTLCSLHLQVKHVSPNLEPGTLSKNLSCILS